MIHIGFGDLFFGEGYFGGVADASFPGPPATLAPWQIVYNNLTFGGDTAYKLKQIDGLDLPTVRTGDAGRPRDPGAFIGLDVLGGRDGLTLTGQMQADSVSFENAWSLLAAATVPGGTTELPMFINVPGFGTLAAGMRVRRRQMPVNIQFVLGKLADFVIQFAGSDPRLYSTPTLSPTVGLPSPSAGFTFPLSFPLAFGGGTVAGVITATNTGNIEMRPIVTITGPCIYPSIANASVPGSPTLQFGVTLNLGDQLVIDTDLHTANLFSAGSQIGSTRLDTLQPGSAWWTIQPGINIIQFLSKDSTPVAGTLEVTYASAWLL